MQFFHGSYFMRIVCAALLILGGCATTPNLKVEPTQPPPVTLSQPPMPPGMFMPKERQTRVEPSFALSATFTAAEEPQPVFGPTDVTDSAYGTIRLIPGGVEVKWANWPTNLPYAVQFSSDLVTWRTLFTGLSGTAPGIKILDLTAEEPTFFYKLSSP